MFDVWDARVLGILALEERVLEKNKTVKILDCRQILNTYNSL